MYIVNFFPLGSDTNVGEANLSFLQEQLICDKLHQISHINTAQHFLCYIIHRVNNLVIQYN